MLAIFFSLAVLYALPNYYGEDFAVQITGEKGAPVSQQTFDEVVGFLNDKQLVIKKSSLEEGTAIIRVNTSEEQLNIRDEINNYLTAKDQRFVVAPNFVPAMPDWLKNIGGQSLKLGLDLRGGIHFLMEVDMKTAIGNREKQYIDDIKTQLREKRVFYASIDSVPNLGILAKFRTEELRDEAEVLIRSNSSSTGLQTRTRETENFYEIVITITQTKLIEIKDYAIKQNIATLRNRINELGVAEPVIQQQGSDRILVQLPGIQDSTRAKEILGKTAILQFRLVDESAGMNASRAPIGSELIEEDGRGFWAVKNAVIVDGSHLTDASVGYDERGMPQINVVLDGEGGGKMLAVTNKNVGRPMAIVLIESRGIYKQVDGKSVLVDTEIIKKVVSAPNINSPLGSRFRITGRFLPTEARDLALVLRSGSLIAPIYIVEERTVGPSLGQQNIDMGKTSIMAGFIAVLLFMLVFYRVFGLVANLALVSNLIFIIMIMSLVPGATLTLPGIAGILLTVGMAVDANVLIFERIKEELKEGVNPAQAIHNGYDKAFSTIADANVTTLIAALVLFGVGTGPVAGFAVTLFIGILTSMFTAIVGSRAIINLIYGGKSIKKISI